MAVFLNAKLIIDKISSTASGHPSHVGKADKVDYQNKIRLL